MFHHQQNSTFFSSKNSEQFSCSRILIVLPSSVAKCTQKVTMGRVRKSYRKSYRSIVSPLPTDSPSKTARCSTTASESSLVTFNEQLDIEEPVEVAEEQSPAADLPIQVVSKPSKQGNVSKGLLKQPRLYDLGLPVITAIKDLTKGYGGIVNAENSWCVDRSRQFADVFCRVKSIFKIETPTTSVPAPAVPARTYVHCTRHTRDTRKTRKSRGQSKLRAIQSFSLILYALI